GGPPRCCPAPARRSHSRASASGGTTSDQPSLLLLNQDHHRERPQQVRGDLQGVVRVEPEVALAPHQDLVDVGSRGRDVGLLLHWSIPLRTRNTDSVTGVYPAFSSAASWSIA